MVEVAQDLQHVDAEAVAVRRRVARSGFPTRCRPGCLPARRDRCTGCRTAPAITALAFGIADAVEVSIRAAKYRRVADWCDHRERRCREIDAMDAATRAREAEAARDAPHLDHPVWNRPMST